MPENELDIVVTTDQAAKFFGVTRKALMDWANKGCPKEKRGRWNLKQVFDWWWENLAGDRAAQQSDDESMNEAKRLYWWQKYEGERINNKQRQDHLVPREQIAREWAWRVAEVANGLSAIAKRLPPLLEGKSQSDMVKIIEGEMWKIRDNFCRSGRFCPAEALEEGDAKQSSKKKSQGGKSKSGQQSSKSGSTSQSRYGKTSSTRSKGKKGSSK